MLSNLRDAWSWIEKLVRRIERLESGAMLENSSITNGRLRLIGGLLLIDSGGTLQVVGQFNGNGTFSWSGNWAFTGPGTVSGNVAWSGDLNLTGDIKVLPGGKVQVGDMIIDPANGGSVAFPGGAKVMADALGGVQMIQGTNKVFVGSGLVSLQNGARTFSISGSGFSIDGLPTIVESLANGAVPGTMWVTGSGQMYRVIPD